MRLVADQMRRRKRTTQQDRYSCADGNLCPVGAASVGVEDVQEGSYPRPSQPIYIKGVTERGYEVVGGSTKLSEAESIAARVATMT
jgi:hypothetical protein